jgi:tetratricopeptide (TPR) repeat protein
MDDDARWDELGDALEQIGLSADRSDRLGKYVQLLATVPARTPGHAEVLACIADEYTWRGQLDVAEATYRRAIEDGGRTILSPHVGLLDIALEREDAAAVDDLLALLLAKSRADELVVGDYEWIGESLERAGRLRTALRWFTIPLRDIQPGNVDIMPVVCLNGRWRVRRALDLPIDAYDEAYEVWHEAYDEELPGSELPGAR